MERDKLHVMDELAVIIRSWSARARWQGSLYWMMPGLLCGLTVALILAVAARLFPLLDTTTLILFSIASALTGSGLATAWPWIRNLRRSPASWARRFDSDFRLKERLSTALELDEGLVTTRNDTMRSNQLDDAIAIASGVKIRQMLPFRMPPKYIVAGLAVGLALLITIALPNPQQQVLANRAELQQVEQEQLQALDQTRQQVQNSSTLTEAQKKQLVQALDDAAQSLADPNRSPEQTLAAINDAQSKLDAVRDQSFQDKRDDLQRAGQSMPPDALTNPLANALENGDFKKAADQLRNLTKPADSSLTKEQQQRLAEQMEQIARNVQRTSPSTAQQLREAAQKLREQQTQEAQDALDKVAVTLDQAAQKQATEQEISQAQSSIDGARRAISDAAQKAQSAAGAQQSAGNQAAALGQKSSSTSSGGNTSGAGPGKDSADSSVENGAGGETGSGPSGAANGVGDSGSHADVGSDNSVFAPGRVSGTGQNVVLPDDKGKTVADPNASANPGVHSQASVPYQQVYPQYAKTADDAIQSGSVPSNLRNYVRDYFSSLDPRQR
ncbi:MAG TPA: hypothetical protein VGK87_01300 [Anaerolineae bacterium]|jgi:septal ring factor EnvC (AmiA/AmiB activator)